MLNTGDGAGGSDTLARKVLGGGVGAAGKEKADDLGHRIRTGGMSDEEMAAFFKANPERTVEMAEIATSFQGAAEKVAATDEANTRAVKSATPTHKRRRSNPGDVVDVADFTDDGNEDPAPRLQHRQSHGGRRTSSSKPPAKSQSVRVSGRRVSDDNPFAAAFPLDRQGKVKDAPPFGNALLYAAVLMDGPFQQEDKDHAERHHRVVKSAIAITFGTKGVAEFEAIELDPDVDEMETGKSLRSFCLSRVECSRVIMQLTLARLKSWLNSTLFGIGGPHPAAAG